MKLIIDSGSTKTQWTVLDGDVVAETFYTDGINPYYMTVGQIKQLLDENLPKTILNSSFGQIYFYGTGCSTEANCTKVKDLLASFFKGAEISMNHDLTGAAVALLKEKKGIACILGTGSNSCLWDGHKIVENVPSLGYLLGDEGSGTYLGKLILKAFLSGEADKRLTDKFYAFVEMDFAGVLHKIYGDPQANRWIAGLSQFASANLNEPFIRNLVRVNFEDFLKAQVFKYSGFQESEISFVGSVAYYFRELLAEVLRDNHLKMGNILQKPMDGLIEYYSN